MEVARSGLWDSDKIKYSESEAGTRIGPDGVTRGTVGVVCTRARAQVVTGDPAGSEWGRFRRCGILPLQILYGYKFTTKRGLEGPGTFRDQCRILRNYSPEPPPPPPP